MNEASITAEQTNQPTKRRWKAWAIGLAVVVAAATIALLSTAPKPEPVRVWFVRATNEGGVKRLVFEGTNGMRKEIQVNAYIVGVVTAPVNTVGGVIPPYAVSGTPAASRTSFLFTLEAPPKGAIYSVMCEFHPSSRATPRWWKLRMGLVRLSLACHLPWLAQFCLPPVEPHYIPSTEIKE